jgi:uncharacterized protein (DUF1697 family)
VSATRHVALLRGINVGRAKRVAMADLCRLVEGLGYRDVRTLLNSGNVVFSGSAAAGIKAAGRIEKAMAEELGVSARVTVITADELSEIVEVNPLLETADNHSRLLVAVLADPADRARLAPLARQDWAPGAMALGKRAAYLWCPEGMLENRLAIAVGRALGDRWTTRNWATISKLRALLD